MLAVPATPVALLYAQMFYDFTLIAKNRTENLNFYGHNQKKKKIQILY